MHLYERGNQMYLDIWEFTALLTVTGVLFGIWLAIVKRIGGGR